MQVFKNKNFVYDIFFAMSHGVHRGVLKKGKIDNREFFIQNECLPLYDKSVLESFLI